MIRLSQLMGQQAVALGNAATTGTVKGIGLEGDQIVLVQVSDQVISAEAVRSFEGDVLTYDETSADEPPPGVTLLDPRGSRVLDMNGDGHGQIDDLSITETGRIDSILLSTGDSMPGSRLRAIGTYAAVLNVDLPPPTGMPVA
jgi:hypothetical protein